MFAFPHIITVPLLSSLGSGAAAWPTLGVLFAWGLFAALIGSALGILRDSTRAPSSPAHAACEPVAHPVHHIEHREAA